MAATGVKRQNRVSSASARRPVNVGGREAMWPQRVVKNRQHLDAEQRKQRHHEKGRDARIHQGHAAAKTQRRSQQPDAVGHFCEVPAQAAGRCFRPVLDREHAVDHAFLARVGRHEVGRRADVTAEVLYLPGEGDRHLGGVVLAELPAPVRFDEIARARRRVEDAFHAAVLRARPALHHRW